MEKTTENKESKYREFHGLWIPKRIWEAKWLSTNECLLLSEIAAYDDGCELSDIELGVRMRVSVVTVKGAISNLVMTKCLEVVNVDGKRILHNKIIDPGMRNE